MPLRAIAVSALLGLAGCANFQGVPERPADSQAALAERDPYYARVLTQYYAQGAPEDRRQVRNRFIETRLAAMDAYFRLFKEEIFRQGVASNLAVDLTTLGLNTAGTAVGGATPKTVLHAISGGLIGAKAAVDKNLYFDRTMPALLAQMEARRNEVRLRLMRGMRLGTADYPLTLALSDLEDYFVAGSIPGAIVEVTSQAVEAEARSAEQIRLELESRGYAVSERVQDDPGDRLLACWKPDGETVHAGNERAIGDWLRREGIDASIFFFIRSADHAPDRARAVDDLAGQLTGC